MNINQTDTQDTKMTTLQKTYAVYGSAGRHFSFNAENSEEAKDKLWDWLLYHSMTEYYLREYTVKVTDKDYDLHNEYVEF